MGLRSTVLQLCSTFLEGTDRSRDALAAPWPAGVEMLWSMLAREAHHRVQVILLARQMGFALPYKASDGIWNWEKLWKECGAAKGPGGECGEGLGTKGPDLAPA